MSNNRCVCAVALPCVWLLLSCGCGGSISSSTGLTGPALQSIVVTPGAATVAAGLIQQYTAAGKYSDGSSQPLSNVRWQTSDTTVAKISSGGLVTTSKQGTISVTATSASVIGTAVLTVGPPNIVTLAVSPQMAAVSAGFTQQFAASGTFTDGSSGTVTNAVNWAVSDTTVATVSASGLATTLKQGSITVTASSGSVSSNAAALTVGRAVPTALNIVPANVHVMIGVSPTTQLSAIMTYSDSSMVDVSAVATWTNSNPFTASMNSTGNITPLRTGYTAVGVSSGTLTANTGFTVIAEPRYLYFPSDAGRLASKAIIDAKSGLPRMAGYIQTGANNHAVAPCPTIDPSNLFLYVGTTINTQSPSGEFQSYSIDPASGALSALSAPFDLAGTPVGCIDFEPTGKFAFGGSPGSLLTFALNPSTGVLTQSSPTSVLGTPTRAAVDPLGRYLYVSSFSSGNTAVSALGFVIDSSSGTLAAIPGTPFALPTTSGTFTFHPSGNYVFMANTNGYSIDTYSVSRATGALTLSSTIQTCINPTALRFSPDGAFAYTTCSMDIAHDSNSMTIESFAIGANGALTHLGSTLSGLIASDLTVDPSGQFLYLSTIYPEIMASRIGTDGVAMAPRSIGVQPNSGLGNVVVGGTSPVNYTPKYAFITSSGANTLLTYSVNADGTLTAQGSTTAPTSPFSLSLWPWGSNLVLASGGTNSHLAFYSLANGLPLSGGSLNNTVTAGGAAIDPSGQFAFETDSTSGSIYAYEPASPGGFAWSGQSFAAGPGAGPVVIDPAGYLIYVANTSGGSISGYQYWGTSPQLFNNTSQPGGSLYPLTAEPLLLAVDPNESFLYVVCGDQTLRVFSMSYTGFGQITQVYSLPLTAQPSGLAAEPTGHFLYTSDAAGVNAYSVNSQTGALTAVPLNPAIALSNTTGIYAEPAGQYLYVATGTPNVSGAVYGFSIQSDGTLTPILANPVATPNLPTSMVFSDTIQ